MTDSQALAEARRRWGKKAIVIHTEGRIPQWAMPYAVGVRKGWIDNEILGYGMSWEQAFDAADERERCACDVDPKPVARPALTSDAQVASEDDLMRMTSS